MQDASSNGHAVSWVVNEADRAKFGAMFIQADMDRDGYVSGMEIKDVFLQSRLPQPILAHIWYIELIDSTLHTLIHFILFRALKGPV